jgi:signal transduction histidine kinase
MEGASQVSLALASASAKRSAEARGLDDRLAQSEKMRSIGQLAAGIAHEINTPIQYVGDNIRFLKDAFEDIVGVLHSGTGLLAAARAGQMPAEMIRRLEADCERADLAYLMSEIPGAIQHALDGVERIARIVRAIKEFAHPGPDEKSAADLNAIIETTLTVARNEWKNVADLIVDFDPDLPPVPCHSADVGQVILNLVVNAAHAIEDAIRKGLRVKGAITARTRRRGGWAEIQIGDNGVGIPEAIRSRIFDPFFTTKAIGRGTGQGLAICHAVIVEKHAGMIALDSKPGQGTTFTLRLPMPEEAVRS